MKRILLLTVLILSMVAGGVHADEVIHLCTLTFTNVAAISEVADSCTGLCSKNANCAIDASSGEQLHIEWSPSAGTHTATDWDVEIWTSKNKNGLPWKYYTDAATANGALATLGEGADTQWDITVASNVSTYTFDGTGTDPSISATNPIPGNIIVLEGYTLAGNNGVFDVLTSTTNVFTIWNPSGVGDLNEVGAGVDLFDGTNVAGSVGVTVGPQWVLIKVSENGAGRVDAIVDVTTTKRD